MGESEGLKHQLQGSRHLVHTMLQVRSKPELSTANDFTEFQLTQKHMGSQDYTHKRVATI